MTDDETAAQAGQIRTGRSESVHASAILDVGEAAAYIGLSKATLYTWRTRRPGFGPRAVKAGGALRYRRSDLDAWIDAHVEMVDVAL
jgi:predicted DNA-binding transcriptional regulator AlpA